MKKKTKIGLLWELFLNTLYLSAFTFGGGYVIVSMMKTRFCDQLHYIDEEEILNLVVIAQSAPGAIAVNGAIVLGYKMAGIPGILVCALGTIIPPFVIIYVISIFYNAFITNIFIKNMLVGMRAGVGALIVSVVYDMGKGVMKDHRLRNALIMIGAFVLNYYGHVNIAYIVIGCIVLSLVDTFLIKKVKV